MSVSTPFIQRPIATSLLGFAVLLCGILGYLRLSVSSLPQVDFPTIQVTTQLPGANPDTVASLITAPLGAPVRPDSRARQHGVPKLVRPQSDHPAVPARSRHRRGRAGCSSRHQRRRLDAAAQSPYPPTYAKVNPADTPVVTLALTSRTQSLRTLSDLADTLLAQRLSEVSGVGRVSVEGGLRPAIRIEADLARLASYRLSLEDLRARDRGRKRRRPQRLARRRASVLHHRGERSDRRRRRLPDHRRRLPRRPPGAAARRGRGPGGAGEQARGRLVPGRAGRHPRHPASARRQHHPDRRPHSGRVAAAPARHAERRRPEGRARPHRDHPRLDPDVQFTLVLSAALVVLVVLLFLRTVRATIIAGVALPCRSSRPSGSCGCAASASTICP